MRRRSRPVVRLDAAERVLEAAERARALDELLEGQRRLQTHVPDLPPEPPADAWAHLQSFVDSETEGAARECWPDSATLCSGS
jgi:hypothetical protein